jgi:hypothetical protein
MTPEKYSLHVLREELDVVDRELKLNWMALKEKLDEVALLKRARIALELKKLAVEKIAFPLEKALTPFFAKYPELLDIPTGELRDMFKKRVAIL